MAPPKKRKPSSSNSGKKLSLKGRHPKPKAQADSPTKRSKLQEGSSVFLEKLDDVVLTSEEEADLEKNFDEILQLPYLFFSVSGSKDGSNSSPYVGHHRDDDGSEAHVTTTTGASNILRLPFGTSPVNNTYVIQRNNRASPLSIREPFIKFFSRFSTSEWNKQPEKVYSYLNAAGCIVDPRYFLSISAVEDDELLIMDSVLRELEQDSTCGAWSTFPDFIEEFLNVYDNGFDRLADRLWDHEFAHAEFSRFLKCMRHAAAVTEFPSLAYWYSNFASLAQDFIRTVKNYEEAEFCEYIKLLMDMFSRLLVDLPLVISCQRRMQYMGKQVTPDISVSGKPGIFMVGEVKRFGSHGTNHEEHRGSIPKHGGAYPQQTVLQSGNKEPMPRPSTGPTDRGDAKEEFPYRRLNRREDYKVRCYLPQLLGQLLCALQRNEGPLPLGNLYENVQLGFGVEGFKLRFVKLVLRNTDKDPRPPTVAEFFLGRPIKSDVFLTQEFNLLKKTHLKMFFKMIVTITYVAHERPSYH